MDKTYLVEKEGEYEKRLSLEINSQIQLQYPYLFRVILIQVQE